MTSNLAGTAARESPRIRSLFKGLASFEVQDFPLFFGRQMERQLCLANLRANRITVLYALSGVGKTSLLAAGVVPDVRNRAVRDDDHVPSQAVILLNTWNDDPLARLEYLIDEAMRDASAPLDAPIQRGIESRIVEWTRWMRGPVLIVLDQFERLYTGRRLSSELSTSSSKKLASLVERSDLPVNVMLAVREDSLSVLDHLGDYVPAAKRNWLSLGELTKTGATEAITGPVGWRKENRPSDRCPALENGFVESVLEACVSRKKGPHKNAAERRYDAPLLQLMLKRRWDQAVNQRFKLVAVQFLGQNHDADLSNFVRGHLVTIPADLQKIAAIIFTRLISAAGRPLPQPCAEFVSRGDRDGKPLNPASVQEILDLLSAGERDIRILRESRCRWRMCSSATEPRSAAPSRSMEP